MNKWQSEPLGFALVDETVAGALAIHHVSVSADLGVSLSGAWLLQEPKPGVVRDLMTHRVIEGTSDGVLLTQSIIQERIAPARLAGLVDACEQAEQDLIDVWESYRDEQPIKRKNLVPLKAQTWPDFTEDGDAAGILQRVGKRPYSPDTPAEMRDILALARLVSYVVEAWYDLETERITRAFLRGGDAERTLYPPDWARAHPPYWPKAA